MTRVLQFTDDNRGRSRLRSIHQILSTSPLSNRLDETQMRRYVSLLDRFEEISQPDPFYADLHPDHYRPRVLTGAADVEVSDEEILQIGEFQPSAQIAGWHRKLALDAIDWARNAPKAE